MRWADRTVNFSETVKAQLAGRLVRVDLLAEYQFVSGTIRLRRGRGGRLITQDDKEWKQLSVLGSIEGLDTSIDGRATTQVHTVSGVDPGFASVAAAGREDFFLRPVVVYLQFFDEDWQTLDLPFVQTARLMTGLKAKRQRVEGRFVYSTSLTAETPFMTVRRPAFGYMDDRDQQRRSPGDKGMERCAGMENKPLEWPNR